MTGTGILSCHISKLGHPIREIRERALSQLIAKFNYGFEFDDELSRTRELLSVLLNWFNFENPCMQKDVLSLILRVIKSEPAKYLIRELGANELKENLDKISHIVEPAHRDDINNIMATLNLFSEFQPDDTDRIPVLNIPSSNDSRSDNEEQRHRENVGPVTSHVLDSASSDNSETCYFNKKDKSTSCLRVVLLPWMPLCSSDRKTLALVEDALHMLRSTKKCCQFLKDVFLRDFPPDVFFNSPVIIKKLQGMIGEQERSSDVSEVLLALTVSVFRRIDQLIDPAFKHSRISVPEESSTQIADPIMEEEDIEQLATELNRVRTSGEPDVAHSTDKMLNQLPVPLYCLDTLYQLITAMDRSLNFLNMGDSEEILNLGDLNIALSLSQKLVSLLLKCVSTKIWRVEHNTKLLKDIVQKTFMVMRLGGDLLNKYRISSMNISPASEMRRSAHFIAYVRLCDVLCTLACWSCCVYMPPAPLCALQCALLHAPLALLQPHAHRNVKRTLQRLSTTLNHDYCKKYKDVMKLCNSLEKSILLIKQPEKYVGSPQVISIILDSLPALELHNNTAYVKTLTTIFTKHIRTWVMDEQMWENVRKILVLLMAHQLEWVQEEIYKSVSEHVTKVLSAGSSGNLSNSNERCLQFLFDSTVLLEICCHGLSSENYCIQDQAKQIMLYLLRGKLMMSVSCWYTLLSSLLPVMPILHAYAAHNDILGNAIMRSVEVKVSECMLVPQGEIWAGLARLLYCRCPAAQMHAAHHLCSALLAQEDLGKLLPTPNAVQPDILMTVIRKVKPTNFNLNVKTSDTQGHQVIGLKQIMEVLSSNLDAEKVGTEGAGVSVQASFARASLQQLAVMLQQPVLHDTFLQHNGLQLMCQYLRLSMTVDDYKVFPECAKSCISVLNSVCASSATARTDLAKVTDLGALILRAIFLLLNDEAMVTITTQLLFLVLYLGYILQELEKDGSIVLSMPHCVLARMHVPFPCKAYWKYSSHRRYSNIESVISDEQCSQMVRIRWAAAWYEGIDNVVRWVSVPGQEERGGGEGSIAPPRPQQLQLREADLAALKAGCSLQASVRALYRVQNATTHKGVGEAFQLLAGYGQLMVQSPWRVEEYQSLPWRATLSRFLVSSPASPKDVALLSRVLHFVLAHVQCCMQCHYTENPVSWIMDMLCGDTESILGILKKSELYPKQTPQEQVDITALRSDVVRLVLCCSLAECDGKQLERSRWEQLVLVLLQCLDSVDCRDFHTLGYFGAIVSCLRYLIHAPVILSNNTVLLAATSVLRCTTTCPQIQRHYHGCKGQAVLVDAYVSLAGLLQQMLHMDLTPQNWFEVWWVESGCGLRLVVRCCSSAGVELRAAAFHLLAGLAAISHTVYLLNDAVSGLEDSIDKFATKSLLDPSEASVVREEACRLLANLVASQSSRGNQTLHNEIGQYLESCGFVEVILSTLTKYCSTKVHESQLESNISLEFLEAKEKYEVLSSKSSRWSPRAKLGDNSTALGTAGLVAALADLVHNLSFHHQDSLKKWNADGLFRMFFRCLCCSGESMEESIQLHTSVCRLLARAANCAEVHATISQTRDCIAALMRLLTPFHLEWEENSEGLVWLRLYALQMTGELMGRRAGLLAVWRALSEVEATRAFLHTLLQAIRSKDTDLNKAAFFCLNQLLNGFNKNADLNESLDGIEHFLHDSISIRSYDSKPASEHFEQHKKSSSTTQPELSQESQSRININVTRTEEQLELDKEIQCEATCLSEEMVIALIDQLKFYESQDDLNARNPDQYYNLAASTLASLLGSSARARGFALHRAFHFHLLHGLADIRNHLTMNGKPVQLLKNIHKNNPALEHLNWILLLMTCLMTDCLPAKNCLAENSVAYSLNKLWPWCLTTPRLRTTTIRLLQTFTNDCPKAWGAMCSCAGQQCLLAEVCRLAEGAGSKRAGGVGGTTAKGSTVETMSLQVLQNCAHHTHARTLILKNDIMNVFNKLHPAISKPSARLRTAEREWERLAETLSLYGDGQMRLLEYSSSLCALATQARGCMLNVITNCAFNVNNRVKFLGSAELLQVLMWTLNSSVAEQQQQVAVGGALWALAANNHKAKLTLRSCGVATCVSECITRLRHASPQAEHQRALQLLTYLQRLLAS